MEEPIEEVIKGIIENEKELNKKLEDFQKQYGHIFDEYEKLTVQLEEIEKAKDEVKNLLISRKDYDLHKTSGFRVSVCPIVRLEVSDIDAIPAEYKTTEVVANIKKAKESVKLFGELPKGFKDKTYYRLTWKEDDAK